jgi:hypothetical protein
MKLGFGNKTESLFPLSTVGEVFLGKLSTRTKKSLDSPARSAICTVKVRHMMNGTHSANELISSLKWKEVLG